MSNLSESTELEWWVERACGFGGPESMPCPVHGGSKIVRRICQHPKARQDVLEDVTRTLLGLVD